MLTPYPMAEADKQVISAWHYPGEYAAYDLPPYDEQLRTGTCLCNPQRQGNYLVWREGETIVGFTNLLEEDCEVFLGIGVAPDLCGKGYGSQIAALAVEEAHRRFPGKPVYLEVRTWNTRAVRCYEKAGFLRSGGPFRQKTRMGEGEFYRMVRA